MTKEYNGPDLNAPRYNKVGYNPLNREFFKALRKEHPELKDYTDTQVRKVIKTTNETIYKKIIDHRDGVEFPEFIGFSFIGTCPKKINDNTDYRTSTLYKTNVQHRNFESDDFLSKIFYTNFEVRYRFKFHDLWTFKAGKNFRKDNATNYRTAWKKYIQVDPFLKIAKLLRKEKAQLFTKQQTEILLENYNEFEGF